MNASRLKQLMSSKQAQLGLRFFTYGVMAVSTIVLTTLAIFYAMGFRFNQASLTIEQGGLVQLRSTPEGANVLVDGKQKNNLDTPSRVYLSAGQHTIEMQLNGYQSWSRTFDLQAGQLLWLDYARFIPQDIKTTPIRVFANLSNTAFSPDRRWILLNEAPDSPVFTLFDISDPTKPVSTTTTIPSDQLTLKDGKVGQLTVLEWDFGSRSVLIRHDSGDVHEILRIDRTRADQAVNISRLFGLNISEVHFAGGNQSVVFAQTADVLRRLDIDSSVASATLVSGMKDFVIYGEDRIAFIANQDVVAGGVSTPRQVVGVYQNGGKEVLVRQFDQNASVKISLTEYFRHQYLAINSGDSMVEIVRDPAEKATETPSYAKFDLGKPVKWLDYSSNGRMLAAGSDNTWAVYDQEVGQSYVNSFEGVNVTRPLKWLDDYYLWTDADDKLRIVEFDGQNRREITSLSSGYMVGLSQNGQSLFSFSKSPAGATMQDTRLIVEN